MRLPELMLEELKVLANKRDVPYENGQILTDCCPKTIL
ncbi:MAG: hypothetical protein U9N47_02375 [Thermodesulfobacteriota bacterium]|nr:hypothetical protein [Thermodesulfobacteriota bacterium]